MVAVLVAGCSFNVIGTNVGDRTGPDGLAGRSKGSNARRWDAAPTTPPTVTPTKACSASAPPAPATRGDPGLFCAQARVGKGAISSRRLLHARLQQHRLAGEQRLPSFTFGKYCLSSCLPDPCRAGYSAATPAEKGLRDDSLCKNLTAARHSSGACWPCSSRSPCSARGQVVAMLGAVRATLVILRLGPCNECEQPNAPRRGGDRAELERRHESLLQEIRAAADFSGGARHQRSVSAAPPPSRKMIGAIARPRRGFETAMSSLPAR